MSWLASMRGVHRSAPGQAAASLSALISSWILFSAISLQQ